MNKQLLFTDGSVNTKSNTGYGAYLLLNEEGLSTNVSEQQIVIKKFKDTSSTKLELQVLIWALTTALEVNEKVIIHTDSQNIIGLPGRRRRLEQNDYRSTNNKLLKNHELYRKFYEVLDKLDYELIKVKGHQPSRNKNNVDRMFTLVDRASRKAMKMNT